jgi:hypothetical protein
MRQPVLVTGAAGGTQGSTGRGRPSGPGLSPCRIVHYQLQSRVASCGGASGSEGPSELDGRSKRTQSYLWPLSSLSASFVCRAAPAGSPFCR